jgi:hypothetical protein
MALALFVPPTATWATGAGSTHTPLSMVTPIHYASDAAARGIVRENCELEKAVESDMLAALRAHGRTVDVTAASAAGRSLEVSIERVEGLGGGAATGAKSLSLRARLLVDGKVVHSTMSGYASKGFPIGTTCAALHRDSSKISEELARWLDDVDSADAARAASPVAPASATGT